MNTLRIGILLILVSLSSSSCSHVNSIVTDVKSCINDELPRDKQDLEVAAGQFLKDAFLCDAEKGFDTNSIPECLTKALDGIALALGPDGKRFELCLVDKFQNDPNLHELAKKRARLVRVKLAREVNGR